MKHARSAGRLAFHMGVVLGGAGLAVVVNGFGQRQKRHLGDLEIRGKVHRRVVQSARRVGGKSRSGIAFPNALLTEERSKIYPAVGQMWSRPGRRAILPAATTAGR